MRKISKKIDQFFCGPSYYFTFKFGPQTKKRSGHPWPRALRMAWDIFTTLTDEWIDAEDEVEEEDSEKEEVFRDHSWSLTQSNRLKKCILISLNLYISWKCHTFILSTFLRFTFVARFWHWQHFIWDISHWNYYTSLSPVVYFTVKTQPTL